jgi:hypothetical protein
MRKQLDRLVSWFGLALTLVLLVAGGLLTWGYFYVHSEISDQLSAQQIYFPPSDSPAVAGDQFAAMRQYGGQQLTTGPQAKVYANDFIAIHLQKIGGGKTYAQVSAAALADPTNTQLAATADTLFKGETLRGLLLTASAFWTVGTIAGIGAIVAFVGAIVMAVLTILGFRHASRETEVVTPPADATEAGIGSAA